MPLIKGQSYEWDQILAETNSVSGPVFYLLHRRGTDLITAASIDIAKNPRAPYEVWAGDGEQISRWGDILDAQTEPFEMFVRETDSLHYYRGRFRKKHSSNNQHEIALRLAQVPRGPIYKILFLEEVS
jgi:hypothetical protein